jgi:hypothetical protein
VHGKLCILAITYITGSFFPSAHVKSNNTECQLTLQGGHLKITAVGPLAVVFFNYPFKFCSKLYYA